MTRRVWRANHSGILHQPQADHHGLPLVGRDACQRKFLGAGKDFADQGHNQTPNAICRVALQRE